MLRLSQRLQFQVRWDALADKQKIMAEIGWQASPELPGLWYDPQAREFSIDPDGGNDRGNVVTLNWRRIDPMAGITVITNARWVAPKNGWVYAVSLPDDTLAFWFSETKLNMTDLVLADMIRKYNGGAITVGQSLSEECIDRYFPEDEPLEQFVPPPEPTSLKELLTIIDRVAKDIAHISASAKESEQQVFAIELKRRNVVTLNRNGQVRGNKIGDLLVVDAATRQQFELFTPPAFNDKYTITGRYWSFHNRLSDEAKAFWQGFDPDNKWGLDELRRERDEDEDDD